MDLKQHPAEFMQVEVGPRLFAWIDPRQRILTFFSSDTNDRGNFPIPGFEGCLYNLTPKEVALIAHRVSRGNGITCDLYPVEQAVAISLETPTLKAIQDTYEYLKGPHQGPGVVEMWEEDGEPPPTPKALWKGASSMARAYATGGWLIEQKFARF